MSCLLDYEERQKQVTGDEYQVDTEVVVDVIRTFGKNMGEKKGSLALKVVGHGGRDMSNSVQHF